MAPPKGRVRGPAGIAALRCFRSASLTTSELCEGLSDQRRWQGGLRSGSDYFAEEVLLANDPGIDLAAVEQLAVAIAVSRIDETVRSVSSPRRGAG
jgi:hypothetical protein